MVFSVKTYNNINQIGLKELGNHFQIDGDLAENPDAISFAVKISMTLFFLTT